MKCKIGFMTTRDEKTKKEVPFFLKVRAKDIISVDLTNPLKQTSRFFDPSVYSNSDYSEYLGVDYSEFRYKCNFTKESDYVISTGQITTGETKFYNVMNSEITYRVSRSGLYEVFGVQTVSSPATSLSQHKLILPYDCPGTIISMNVNLLDNLETSIKSRTCNFSFSKVSITEPDCAAGDSSAHRYIINVSPYSSSGGTFGFTIRGHV